MATYSKVTDHLDKKMRYFLSYFSDSVQKEILNNAYFAGGCIWSLVQDKRPRDYDIFLRDISIVPRLKEETIWSSITDNALSLGLFQVIIRDYGEPEDCIGRFDFRHNMYYYFPGTGEIRTANKDGDFSYLHSNRLLFNEERARDIERVYLRIKKFTKRGFVITEEEKNAVKKKCNKLVLLAEIKGCKVIRNPKVHS